MEKGEKVVGTNQFAGTELMTIADLSKMEAKVEVNENDKTDNADAKPGAKEPEQFEVVFVNQGGLARQKKVKTGIQDNTNIEIAEGFTPDEEIITAPYGMISKTLKDSMHIEVVKIEDLYKVKK